MTREEMIVENISEEEAKKVVWDEVRDLGYKEGLEKAWEVAKRIVLNPKDGGLPVNEFHELFGSKSGWYNIFQGYTVYDVIEALDKYDERNEICVGDEVKVTNTDISGVVTKVILDDCVLGICVDGSVFSSKKERLKKTGNHFVEVGKLLEVLREGETE
jgi:hypothetical protein